MSVTVAQLVTRELPQELHGGAPSVPYRDALSPHSLVLQTTATPLLTPRPARRSAAHTQSAAASKVAISMRDANNAGAAGAARMYDSSVSCCFSINSQQHDELPRTATVVLRPKGLGLTSVTSLSLFHKPPLAAGCKPQAVQTVALA